MASPTPQDDFTHTLAIKLSRALNIVNPNDLGRVNVAFFDANMWLALTMLAGVVADVTWRSLT